MQLRPRRSGQQRIQEVPDLQQEALQDLQSEITSCLHESLIGYLRPVKPYYLAVCLLGGQRGVCGGLQQQRHVCGRNSDWEKQEAPAGQQRRDLPVRTTEQRSET